MKIVKKIMHTSRASIAALDLSKKIYDMTQIITKNKRAFVFIVLLTSKLISMNGITAIIYSDAKFLIPSVEPGLVL